MKLVLLSKASCFYYRALKEYARICVLSCLGLSIVSKCLIRLLNTVLLYTLIFSGYLAAKIFLCFLTLFLLDFLVKGQIASFLVTRGGNQVTVFGSLWTFNKTLEYSFGSSMCFYFYVHFKVAVLIFLLGTAPVSFLVVLRSCFYCGGLIRAHGEGVLVYL